MKIMKTNFDKNKNPKLFKLLVILSGCLLGGSNNAFALTYPLPKNGDVVGKIQMTTVRRGECLADIGRRYDLGVYEMIEANPKLDPWSPAPGSVVVVPSQFILPSGPREGIIINLAEMRIYAFHPDKPLVTTHPIGIGKKGWSTPLGVTKIVGKKVNPTWHVPKSIQQEHLAKGDPIAPVIYPGPDNPLGRHALYLSMAGVLIHGTNKPVGVGVRGSHGCIRMLPEDIASMFYTIPIGMTVRIVHEPYKVGWHKDRLYIEAHQPLTEGKYAGSDSLNRLTQLIQNAIRGSYVVNWSAAKMAAQIKNGYPTRID